MADKRQEGDSMSFIAFNANPINRNTGDCTVRAISALMNQSWRDTHADLAMTSFYLSDMPSSNRSWGEYLYLNGYRSHMIPDTCPACYTIRQFAKDHPYGRYLLATGTHVVAVIDGDYYDTWDSGDEVPLFYWKEKR